MELTVTSGDLRLPATLDLPAGAVRAGLIPLHGAGEGQRSSWLFEHLALVLPACGIAVLRYDRRPKVDGADVPLRAQAADARAAADVLRAQVPGVPVIVWGFSQGAWAAAMTAAEYPDVVAALVVVSCSGVSPAEQMRYGTAEQLRRHGYGDADLRELAATRAALEAHQRGEMNRLSAQAQVDRASSRPWFALSYVPRQLPAPGSWDDMDFAPGPVFQRVSCPVLAYYGQTDAWVPVGLSTAAWEQASRPGGRTDLTIIRLPNCDHWPATGESPDLAHASREYTDTMVVWLDRRLDGAHGSIDHLGSFRRGER